MLLKLTMVVTTVTICNDLSFYPKDFYHWMMTEGISGLKDGSAKRLLNLTFNSNIIVLHIKADSCLDSFRFNTQFRSL